MLSVDMGSISMGSVVGVGWWESLGSTKPLFLFSKDTLHAICALCRAVDWSAQICVCDRHLSIQGAHQSYMCAFVQISVSKLWLCVHNACAHICESTVVTCARCLCKYLWANCKCKETRLTMLLSEDSWVSGSRLRCRSSNFGTFQVQKQYSMILFRCRNNTLWYFSTMNND